MNYKVYRTRLYENEGFPDLVNLVDPSHHRVLDVGCGNGANLCLLSKRGHDVVGLTLSHAEAEAVRQMGFLVQIWDITQEALPFPPKSFDALVFSHVLEHLPWPQSVLKSYLRMLRPGGGVYVTLPNVMQFNQRWLFLRGRFRYTELGLMDRTHLRFFDFESACELLESTGLEIVQHCGIGQFPMGPLRELTPRLSEWMDRLVSRAVPGLFAFHIVVVGRLGAKQ